MYGAKQEEKRWEGSPIFGGPWWSSVQESVV